MDREKFKTLLSKIQDHPNFKNAKSKRQGRRQRKVEEQLASLLAFLGTEGSGGSCPSLRNVFYFGRGSLIKYRHRVAEAIVDCLGSDYCAWPDEQERDKIAAEMEARYNLQNCVGVIDGTLFLLAFKPQSSDAGDYCGRKGDSITNLIVSDHKRWIRYYIAGWPGGSHDNRVKRNCRMSQCPHAFFSVGEYIIGDSAFQGKWYLIPSFKELNNTGTSAMRQSFNSLLAKGRAISEHTNGILKGRFACLRSIRQDITDDTKSMKDILLMVHCNSWDWLSTPRGFAEMTANFYLLHYPSSFDPKHFEIWWPSHSRSLNGQLCLQVALTSLFHVFCKGWKSIQNRSFSSIAWPHTAIQGLSTLCFTRTSSKGSLEDMIISMRR
jgi:hypothetical protein